MNKTISHPWLMALGVMALLAVAALLLIPASATNSGPPAQAVDKAQGAVPVEGCELLQTLVYSRCGHTVVRRVTAPVELYGQTAAGAEALYPDWRITEFGEKLIRMERQLRLFCPDHMVLMPDDAGMLCVYENKYGDAMSLVRELNVAVRDLPAAAREEAEAGVGFATPEEMDMWLESVES